MQLHHPSNSMSKNLGPARAAQCPTVCAVCAFDIPVAFLSRASCCAECVQVYEGRVVEGDPSACGHVISTTATSGLSGSTINYSTERVVGNGSFGVVFQATCLETGETVCNQDVLHACLLSDVSKSSAGFPAVFATAGTQLVCVFSPRYSRTMSCMNSVDSRVFGLSLLIFSLLLPLACVVDVAPCNGNSKGLPWPTAAALCMLMLQPRELQVVCLPVWLCSMFAGCHAVVHC